MTKVETEVVWRKNELLALCSTTDIALNETIKKHLDSLISAARSEGVREGEEQLKVEIRAGSEHYHGDPTVEGGSYYVVLDAVLAPTKENDNGKN